MRLLPAVLSVLCGFCFLVFLLVAGGVAQTYRMFWSCLPAWPFMAVALIAFVAIFGFWSGLGLWFAGLWIVGFFASGQWLMVKTLFSRKIAVQ